MKHTERLAVAYINKFPNGNRGQAFEAGYAAAIEDVLHIRVVGFASISELREIVRNLPEVADQDESK